MNQFQYTQRPNPLEDLKKFFRGSAILPRLIIINLVIWALVQVVTIIGWAFNYSDILMQEYILDYLALPANMDMLIRRPWTLFTYMFLHTSPLVQS